MTRPDDDFRAHDGQIDAPAAQGGARAVGALVHGQRDPVRAGAGRHGRGCDGGVVVMDRSEPLPFHGVPAWQVPQWVYTRNRTCTKIFITRADMIHRCVVDGIPQVAPIVAAFGADPGALRARFGKGLWKRVHHSELRHNVMRALLWMQTAMPFEAIMAIPLGALPEANGKVLAHGKAAYVAAIPFATGRNDMREAVMLTRDVMRMAGEIKAGWSLRRLREEHDRLARDVARRSADPTPFAEPWSREVGGFTFERLVSHADFAAEGMAMHHCIAGYGSAAKAGREVAFRITGQERASVSFSRTHMELKGPCNRAVTSACRAATVSMWAQFQKEHSA